jgi:hypothetical protein
LARLYADENFPYPAVEALRSLGHEVLTAQDAGQAGLGVPDVDVLAFAHSQGRALLTHNRKHFRSLHKGGHAHSGLILCTEDPEFDALAARIDSVLSTLSDQTGQLIRINRPPT